MAPLDAAQVYIRALQTGVLSQANGRYLLVNLPAGTHTVQVERIGYRTESREVTVTAGGQVDMNFELSEDALALDEIVVTGTAGQARRREVGNTVAQVNVTDVVEPVANVGAMLQGRLAGVRVIESGGASGSGADIRLRGNVSMSMSNQPLIYIDGVRAKSELYPTSGGVGRGGGVDPPSPLGDLNPNDIERIEIVKGPAATTLYGTEAAAGVIQIFTKSGGTSGAPVWSADVQQGYSYMRPHFPEETPYLFAEPILRKGHRQNYSLSVRGGTADRLGYFLSGSIEDDLGAWVTDYQKIGALRGNTQFRPHEDLNIQFNNSYTHRQLSTIGGGGTGESVYFALARGDLAGYVFGLGARSPEQLREALDQSNITDTDRVVNGLSITWTPATNFSHRLTLGHDFSTFELEKTQPFCWMCGMGGFNTAGFPGAIVIQSEKNTLRSIDYVGSYAFDLLQSLSSTFSFGFQGVENLESQTWAWGQDFPGPGEYTVSSTARREGQQSKLRTITGGFFFQDMLALSDRYFLTLGLRVDGNSAFGSGLGLQPYPKVSMSYVLSDETFWPESLGSMKLRAAYGLAGRAPGAFDAVRTWNPAGWGNDQAAFLPQNLGNPDLGPERTKELEVGFDGSFLSDRLTADVTYYSKATIDALFRVQAPSSEGGWNAQLQNVGEISNSGLEVSLNANVISGASFGWDVGAGIMTNSSEVVSLGGAAPFSVGSGGWVIEGEAAPVIRGHKIENYYEAADPIITPDAILGPAFPTLLLNGNMAFTLPGGIVISGRGEYSGGNWIQNGGESGAMSRFVPVGHCFDAYRKVDPTWEIGSPSKERAIPNGPKPATLLAWERANCFGQVNSSLSTHPSDYFELRDITLSIPLSSLLPSLTSWSNRTDLTVSGRNVWGWKHERLAFGHPESGNVGGRGSVTQPLVKSIANGGYPIQSFVTVSLRAVF